MTSICAFCYTKVWITLSICLDRAENLLHLRFTFFDSQKKKKNVSPFFFFWKHIPALLRDSSGSRVLFMDSQISFFNKTFIKNELHGTIHTFKNYFTF